MIGEARLVVVPVELVGRWREGVVGASFPQIHRRVGRAPKAFLETSLDKWFGRCGVADGFDEIVIVWF